MNSRRWIGIGVLVLIASALVGVSWSKLMPIVPGTLKEVTLSFPTAVSPSKATSIPNTPSNQKSEVYMTIDQTKSYSATMMTTKGVMVVHLYPKETPETVNNFVILAQKGFYNKTLFHRIIKGFMIQGGDPKGDGTGGPGYKFNDEPITRDYTRGTIAMANSGPNTNGSQFFVMHADYNLPKNYVIFGSIDASDSASLSTLDALSNSPVGDNGIGENSKPLEPVLLQSVTINEQ